MTSHLGGDLVQHLPKPTRISGTQAALRPGSERHPGEPVIGLAAGQWVGNRDPLGQHRWPLVQVRLAVRET